MGDRAFAFLRYLPGGDTTGHFGLYAGLAYAFAAWGRRSVKLARVWVWIVVTIGALVGVEEVSQAFIATRTFSLVDLAASWLGLLVGSVLSAWPVSSSVGGSRLE